MKMSNKNKRVLIISIYFAPDSRVGGKRFTFLSKIFSGKFSELHVLTIKEKFIVSRDNTLNGYGKIHRAAMFPKYPIAAQHFVKRILKKLWEDYLCVPDVFSGWIVPAVHKGYKIIKNNNIDVIVATGPPFSPMVTGLILSRLTGANLVLDYRDPWTNHTRKFCKLFGKKINHILEKYAIRQATAIVFCTRKMKENFELQLGRYKNRKVQTYVITNGLCNRDEVNPICLDGEQRKMIYAGNFYGKRNIDIIASTLSRLLRENVINPDNFRFYLFGELKRQDKQILSDYNLNQIVKENSPVAYEKILGYLKAADILFLQSAAHVGYAIPFKFFDYLSVKKPIFAIAPKNSAVSDLMKEIDCGQVAELGNENLIYEELKKILIQNKIYTFANVQEYFWDRIGEKYISVIDAV